MEEAFLAKERKGAMKQERQKEQKKVVNGVAPGEDALSIQKRIALRAYELHLQRGGVDGRADEDWLQAEREIMSKQEP
jgi:Protein of unknown function (DUF2934)